jgi:hypothetical protein
MATSEEVAMVEGAEETSPLIVPTQLVVCQTTGHAPKEIR